MIAIIGGGIIGTAIAYSLSRAGLKDIILIEKEKLLGAGVTQYCSGGVRHQFTTEINCKFSIESMKTLNALAKEIDYKKYGYLILDMEKETAGPRVKMQNALGIMSELLPVKEIAKRFPFLSLDGVVEGSFYKEDGVADPAALLSYYEKEARKAGVKFLMETVVRGISRDEKGIALRLRSGQVGIRTDKGEIKTDWVILAAGVQSKELGKTIGLDIPIVNRRKYVLMVDGFKDAFPLVMEIPTGWYIKKEGADALVGMSGKTEEKGLEKQAEAVEETVEASIRRVPALEKAGIKKVLTSLSDETPDKHAIIDMPIPGLIIATGFSGHGFMHSPATGQIVASMLKGEKPVIDAAELRLNRKLIKESIAI